MASASEILKAYLHCARTPAEDAVERIRTQLKKQYGAAEVEPLLDEVNHSDALLNRLR